MLDQLKYGWNLMRIIRLAIAGFAITQAFLSHDWLLGIFGGIVAYMALANIGCCGVGGCSTNTYQRKTINHQAATEEVTYEEVDHQK
ncbi:hypothetical protein [Hydrotalea sp.]|uniref:hypothetical protein n=1 Tax=Hydrotalea sp. TaxID=2881279 RepID=UPI00258626D0|nr:hypothetical protein [Hydrotalea sp.]